MTLLRDRICQSARLAASSLTVRLLVCVGVYVTFVAALLFVTFETVDRRVENAFPTMETVLEYESDLQQDRFDALPASITKNCEIAVFDGEGNRLYASDTIIAANVSASDLSLLEDYEGGRGFYDILESEDSAGRPVHTVILCRYDEDTSSVHVEDYCVLDSSLTVVEGGLLGGRQELTEREFNLLKGLFGAGKTIEKTTYETASGEPRTLVLVSPLVTDASYSNAYSKASSLWAVAAAAALAGAAVVAVAVVRIVQRGIHPLDRAIAASRGQRRIGSRRGGEKRRPGGSGTIAAELAPTYDSFNELMGELSSARDENRRIVADVSHDLKTPLTVIRGYAQALYEGRVPPEKQQDYLKALVERSTASADLLDSLLAYASTEHPDYRPNMRREDVCRLVRAFVAHAHPLDRAIAASRGQRRIGSRRGGEKRRPGGSGTIAAELAPTYDSFNELMGELSSARDENRRIVADVSHDLKTPLTVIRGYAQALYEGRVPPEKQQDYLKALVERSTASADLLDSLLAYASTEHPDYRPNMRREDVCRLVRAFVAHAVPEAERSGGSIDACVPKDALFAQVDELLFRRMLSNLVGNSFAHNPAGTHVEVSCERRGDAVVIAVADTGLGIPVHLRGHAFEAFVTGDDARSSTSGSGTGLGLSIARRCATLMGGALWFADSPREPFATEAIIELPLDEAGAEES